MSDKTILNKRQIDKIVDELGIPENDKEVEIMAKKIKEVMDK